MGRERSNPPEDWTTINPEVVNIASMAAMMRHELAVLFAIAIVIPIATLLGFFPFYLAILIGFLCFLGMLFYGWVPFVSRKQTAELHRYLSWIFATQPGQERNVLLKPYPIEVAYRPVGTLLIAEIYGEENQLEHEIVVSVPQANALTKESLNVRESGKIHYDPETHEPVVIDFGSFRCWRALGFASPPDATQKAAEGKLPWRQTVAMSRLHPTTAAMIWVVVFGFCFRFFISPDAFMAMDGRGGFGPRKWGFIGNKGRVRIKPLFDRVKGAGVPSSIGPLVCQAIKPQKSFHEGLAAVCIGDQWGFIDKWGNIAVQPQFDDVGDFSEGLACVVKDDKCGFIDRTGQVAIPLQFDRSAFNHDLMYFKDGFCVVQNTPFSMNYINKRGELVLGRSFMDAAPFSEGLAVIELMRNGTRVIDKSGAFVFSIPVKWRGFANVTPAGKYSEGNLRICGWTRSEAPQPRYWFVDKTGKPVGSHNYKAANDFSEGLAAVMPMGSNKYGFIDQTGELVINPAYELPGDFHDGLAPVRLYHGDKGGESNLWGYIDKKGQWLVQPQFTSAQPFSEGRAAVRMSDGLSQKEGYIDTTGQLRIHGNFTNCFPFSEELAAVEMLVHPPGK